MEYEHKISKELNSAYALVSIANSLERIANKLDELTTEDCLAVMDMRKK